MRIGLVWQWLNLPTNWSQVHINGSGDWGGDVLRGWLLELAVGAADGRLLPLLDKDILVLGGLETSVHHASAWVERLASSKLKVLLALKAFDLHLPVIVGERPHLFLVSAGQWSLSNYSWVIEGLCHKLVSLSLLRHSLTAIFHIVRRTGAEISLAISDSGCHRLHFHDVRVETLRVHKHVLLSTGLSSFIVSLLVHLFCRILWIVHKSTILLLAKITGRLNENLWWSHITPNRGRFFGHISTVSLPFILTGLCSWFFHKCYFYISYNII